MRGVTPEFVNMSKEILYPKFRVLQTATTPHAQGSSTSPTATLACT
jgi:hypothetical protein